jgi:predicted DNA-binding transcriptional regulator AlpA
MDVPRFPANIQLKAIAMGQFLTINGVAQRYATTKHSVYRWLRDDRDFPKPIRLPGKTLRWSPADLEAWESTRRVNCDEYA